MGIPSERPQHPTTSSTGCRAVNAGIPKTLVWRRKGRPRVRDAAKWFVPSETVVGTTRAAEDNDDVEGAPATRHQCDALLVSPRIMELAETANPEGLGARVGVSQM